VSSLYQLRLAKLQGFEASGSAGRDPVAEPEQVVSAPLGPAPAPAFEPPSDDGFDVSLPRSDAVGQPVARFPAAPRSESIHGSDRLGRGGSHRPATPAGPLRCADRLPLRGARIGPRPEPVPRTPSAAAASTSAVAGR
jgi:hypothetical protein